MAILGDLRVSATLGSHPTHHPLRSFLAHSKLPKGRENGMLEFQVFNPDINYRGENEKPSFEHPGPVQYLQGSDY